MSRPLCPPQYILGCYLHISLAIWKVFGDLDHLQAHCSSLDVPILASRWQWPYREIIHMPCIDLKPRKCEQNVWKHSSNCLWLWLSKTISHVVACKIFYYYKMDTWILENFIIQSMQHQWLDEAVGHCSRVQLLSEVAFTIYAPLSVVMHTWRSSLSPHEVSASTSHWVISPRCGHLENMPFEGICFEVSNPRPRRAWRDSCMVRTCD